MPSKSEIITALQNSIGDLEDLFVNYFGEESNTDVEWTEEEEEQLNSLGQTIGLLQEDVIALEEMGNEEDEEC